MQILSIHLKNIKSHREAELAFSPGINVLSGPNGVGKSTVFEAIGYALFGVDARDFVSNVDRFLTIGSKRGEIAVTFTPGDGDTYRVTRTVGTPSTWRLARENGGNFEVEDHANAAETEERIRELLRLAKGRPLADQFKLVIGPFQNDFLGPFVLKQSTKRKEAFDEILGIDSWRKTFDGTKELGTVIKGKIATIETEIAGKEERAACLPQRQEELRSLVQQEDVKGKELADMTAALAAVTEQVRVLEERKSALDTVRNDISQVEQSLASGKDFIATQIVLVDEAEVAARTVEQTRPGKERFEAAEKRLHDLREREKARNALEKEAASLKTLIASALQAVEHEEREAAEQEKRGADIAKTMVGEESSLRESQANLAQAEEKSRVELDRLGEVYRLFRALPLLQVNAVAPYLRLTLARLVEVDEAFREKERLLAAEGEWRERAAALETLRKKREELVAEKSRILGKRAGIVEGEAKLKEGVCPFLQEECRNLDGKNSLEPINERKKGLDQLVEDINAAMSVLEVDIAGAEAAAGEMEKFRLLRNELLNLEKERLEREKERATHIGKVDCAGVIAGFTTWTDQHHLADCRALADRLVGADFSGGPAAQLAALKAWEICCHDVAAAVASLLDQMVSAAEAPLAAVNAEKGRIAATAEELRRRRAELVEMEKRAAARRRSAATHRASAEKTQVELQSKTEALKMFDDVEGAIRQAEEEKLQSQPDQQRFLQAEPVARDLAPRREKLEKYRKRLADLEKERSDKAGRLLELEKAYSADLHVTEKEKKDRLQSSVAALAENLKHIASDRSRLLAEIAVLEKVREEISHKQEEARGLRRKEELVKFLRNKVFKNVSAQLSERFREEISIRADRIYRTIAESDEELIWGDDYRIVLRDMVEGEVRERTDDQLSGGQTMSAVVALRLALLQTIGARIAFFDEPTSNLDSARRENLAQAFRAIDHGKEEVTEHWYDQLFLISHDVAFTEVTDQVIAIGE